MMIIIVIDITVSLSILPLSHSTLSLFVNSCLITSLSCITTKILHNGSESGSECARDLGYMRKMILDVTYYCASAYTYVAKSRGLLHACAPGYVQREVIVLAN